MSVKEKDLPTEEKKDVKRNTVVTKKTIIKNKKEKENGIYYSYEGVEYLRVDGMSHVFLPKICILVSGTKRFLP